MSSLNTSIEWTDRTWSPVRGCRRVSPGCDNCYAMRQAHRFAGPGQPYEGLTVLRPKTASRPGVDWAGSARLHPEMLGEPLRWRKPQRVFVNSMSDLFHESLSNEEIAAVFGVMAACPRHTFMVLTKRPERAAAWFKWVQNQQGDEGTYHARVTCYLSAVRPERRAALIGHDAALRPPWPEGGKWPLPNVHLGVSCEDQDAWKRLAVLVHQCPAAVHWASCEPLLGPINIGGTGAIHLNWLVLGSESGNGARPMEVAWARSLVDQCIENGIPVFTKQIATGQNGKGGDPATWPAGNWPRQYPEVRA